MKNRETLYGIFVLLLTGVILWAGVTVALAADPVALAGDTTGATKQTVSEIGEKLDLESVAKKSA